ncbi:MAG: DUF167 domain-containing protein [Verrucomicrobiae bacterium]|nr:DUF167 domain-containing protein [Verrucomicrobiae bacterium]
MSVPPPCIRETAHGVDLILRVRPRASRNRIGPPEGDALAVWVTAPPVDAAANEAVLHLLAEALGRRRGDLALMKGATARRKVVRVAGLTGEQVLARLQPASPELDPAMGRAK